MVRAIGAADVVLDVATGSQTQAEIGYATIDWALSLTKTGGGTLVLDAANGVTGPVVVKDGTLAVTRSEALKERIARSMALPQRSSGLMSDP